MAETEMMDETVAMKWDNEDELERSIYRSSFEEFVRAFWVEVPGSGTLKWNWHLSLFCEVLQEAAERVFKGLPNENDICLNVSPGTSKSTVWSILFPAWCWTRMPSCRFITASHTNELALDLANKSRTVIKSEKYRRLFPEIEFREDQDSKGFFANTLGGDRKTCTVAGISPIGFHGHILVCDDLLDPKKVLSEVECKTASDFLTNVLPSRKVDKKVSVTLLVMQRLGMGDPTEVMLKEAAKEGAIPVRHICLPAELSKGDDGAYQDCDVKPQELARRYVDGLMDPHRLDRQALAPFKARGFHYYATQFLQKPFSLSGGLFHEDYFNQRVKASPYHARRIRYFDRASSGPEKGGCRTAGVLMSRSEDGNFYIEDVVVGEWEPFERNQILLATALKDRAKYGPKEEPTIWIEAEGGSSGKDAFQGIARILRGFNVRQQNVSRMGNKVTRAEPWSAQLAAGTVYIVDNGESEGTGKAGWDINDYVQEHCVVGNTLIFTDKGMKRADRIKVGDKVYTHMGRFREVEKIESRMTNTVRVISAKGLDALKITPSHRVRSMELQMKDVQRCPTLVGAGLEWKKASDMKSRDYKLSASRDMEPYYVGGCDGMTIPILNPDYNLVEIDLRAFYSRENNGGGRYTFLDDGETIRMRDGRSQALKYKQRLDYDFGKFCGLYLAEGSGCMEMSFHKKETEYMKFVSDFLLNRMGIRCRMNSKYSTNQAGVAASLKRLEEFFNTFGRGASKKRIPWWCWNAPKEFHRGLVDGWIQGDGGTTVSRHLAWGMRLVGTRLGYWSGMTVTDNRGQSVTIDGEITGYANHLVYRLCMEKRKYTVARRYEDTIGLYVKENKEERGEVMVWNFQVAEDNSYTTTGGCVHNCAFPLGKLKDLVDSSSGAFSLLAGVGDMKKGLRTYSLGSTKHKGLRIVATSVDQLPLLDIAEHPCLLIHLHDPTLLPDPVPLPEHALRKLVDSLQLQFMDIDPADFQEKWDVQLEPFDMTPQQLMMQAEQGKAIWNRILRRREPPVEVVVIADSGDNRALSVALAVCDVLSLDRSNTIYIPEEPDRKLTKADKAPNDFVYTVTKLSRNSVM